MIHPPDIEDLHSVNREYRAKAGFFGVSYIGPVNVQPRTELTYVTSGTFSSSQRRVSIPLVSLAGPPPNTLFLWTPILRS